MSDFGKRLLECLELRGRKQQDIVDYCHISKSNLSKYINGKLPTPKLSTIQKIAKYLEVDPAYLLGISDQMITHRSDHIIKA